MDNNINTDIAYHDINRRRKARGIKPRVFYCMHAGSAAESAAGSAAGSAARTGPGPRPASDLLAEHAKQNKPKI